MCEKPASLRVDLGRQEPRGCRFIYGDPGDGDWHFCQRTLVDGAEPGNAHRPPYCARHAKVCRQPAKAFAYSAKWLKQFLSKQGVLDVDPERGDRQRIPVDLLLHLRVSGAISHD